MMSVPLSRLVASSSTDTVTSIRLPTRAKGPNSVVTMTAAMLPDLKALSPFRSAVSFVVTMKCCSMSTATCCVNVCLLPVPLRPTTNPKPTRWLLCEPSRSVMSLMRTSAAARPDQAEISPPSKPTPSILSSVCRFTVVPSIGGGWRVRGGG